MATLIKRGRLTSQPAWELEERCDWGKMKEFVSFVLHDLHDLVQKDLTCLVTTREMGV